MKMSLVLFILFTFQLTFGASEFFFHWGSRNRIQMLLKHKQLNEKAFKTASFGVNNGAFYGTGLYISTSPSKWSHLGEQVLVIYAPSIDDPALRPLGNRSKLDFIYTSASPSVRILSFEEGLKLLLSERSSSVDQQLMEKLIHAAFKSQSRDAISIIEKFKNDPQLPEATRKYLQKLYPSLFEDFDLFLRKSIAVENNLKTWERKTSIRLNETFFDLRRFFTESDFIKITSINHSSLESFYSDLSINARKVHDRIQEFMPGYEELNKLLPHHQWSAWTHALKIVSHESSQPLSIEILKYLHRTVYPSGSDFTSYYLQELQKMKDNSQRREAQKLADVRDWNAFRQLTKIPEPLGVIRTGAIYISRPGSSSENQQGAFFTEESIYRLMANPHLKVTIQSTSAEGVKAKVVLPANSNLEAEVIALIDDMNKSIEQLKSQEKHISRDKYVQRAIEIASDFYWEFSSRHIFWDGSGRTARLARDWVLEHMGLPPAAYTPENDWELTKEEMRIETKKAVAETMAYYEQKIPSPYTFIGLAERIARSQQRHNSMSCRVRVAN